MAIFYYSEFPSHHSSGNFGDDINPFLLGRLFSQEILESKEVCLVGIGTLINDDNIRKLQPYKKKLVFSTGVGYGDLTTKLDDSWEVVCVRGPKSAEMLGVSRSKAICDGAILLSDFFEPIPESRRRGTVFIPHIKTHWACGSVLKPLVHSLGWTYLTPDRPYEEFINTVKSAQVVVSEAMHGAILADTMRVPWIPVDMHQHNQFKWQDWHLSIGTQYTSSQLRPVLWNPGQQLWKTWLKIPYQRLKTNRVKERLEQVANSPAVLSEDHLLKVKKEMLYQCVAEINHQ